MFICSCKSSSDKYGKWIWSEPIRLQCNYSNRWWCVDTQTQCDHLKITLRTVCYWLYNLRNKSDLRLCSLSFECFCTLCLIVCFCNIPHWVLCVFSSISNHQLFLWGPIGVLTAECPHFPMLSGTKGHHAATATVVTTPRTQGLSCVAAHIAGWM